MPDLNRRRLLNVGVQSATGVGLLALAGRGAYQSFAPAEARVDGATLLDRPLRIGYLPITDASALLTAYHRGILEANGVPAAEPILFRSWDALAQALTTDQVDLVHLLMPMALQLRVGQGAGVKVIGWGHTNGSTLTVRPDVARLTDLAGTTVAIPYWWSVHNLLLQEMLRSEGLTPITGGTPSAVDGTVALTVMAPADMVPALGSGAIGGFVVADPFSAVAEKQGIGRVFRFLGDVWRDHACCAICVQDSFTTEHPDAARAVALSIVQAQQWLDEHRAEAGALLTTDGGFLPQPEPAVSRIFNRTAPEYADVTTHADWHGERLGFQAFPARSYTDEMVRLMQGTESLGDRAFLETLKSVDPHAELVDDRFVAAALNTLGLSRPDREELIDP